MKIVKQGIEYQKAGFEQIPDILLNDGGNVIKRLYRFERKVKFRVDADTEEQAKELLKNGFIFDYEIMEEL